VKAIVATVRFIGISSVEASKGRTVEAGRGDTHDAGADVPQSPSCFTMTTGQAACWAHSWLTEPSLSPAKPPPWHSGWRGLGEQLVLAIS
jgi:hypothetical protein